ncbi:Bacterial extracellular solute-binding protein, family 7 [Pelagimonas phthalicica]|uniref:Bacterial extracellular solute-binding protein, family 7 n=1 Tax=Pelagimonas phthalicica TaxID=1037362 RepID=A0A238JGS2_9RHOB|nr:TRAP transporter substrate-binding protein DctP [Pelagimonas phthalicica]TDS89723.1 TRAP-type C4-dicarboxylate transport system substrate-binding protein [Pelagimonas phthalicica]SMX29891.1 Bacterial extracellular solute-binding protein, family 7 [Pelagimonas phthalicica]
MTIKEIALLGLTALAPLAAQAETLTFASTNAEPVPINRFFEQWVEDVNVAAGGSLEINLRHGPTLANHTNYYDRVVDGVVDIVWGMSVFNPGKFTNSLVMTIPFFVESSEQGSLAACRMFEKGAFGADYEGLKPLMFANFPQSSFHTTETPIDNGLRSMAGLNVIATSPPAVEITKGNDGTPLSVQITEAYEALQRGTADGMVMSFTAFPAFKLGDVLKHHYVAPLGGALGAVFMTEESYEALSDEAKAVIDAHTTCDTSRELGVFVDNWNAGAMNKYKNSEGHTFSEMSPEEVQGIIGYVGDEILGSFAENMPGGQPLVDALLQELDTAK